MPIHDYRCRACGAQFEALARGGATPPCPRCAAPEPERLVSRIAPAGTTKGLLTEARRQALREGHFSHYSKAERGRIDKG